jgi:predicted GNAT family N-acyltransferase
MNNVLIKRIALEDHLYQQERELRNRILLRPIGIPDYGWEQNDANSWHFVAIENEKVVGCVVLVRLDEKVSKTQLIQMAVEKDFQGRGIGRMLVEHLVEFASKQEVQEIQIHARDDVTAFYEQLGFEIVGEPFYEVGIKHRHMLMRLD